MQPAVLFQNATATPQLLQSSAVETPRSAAVPIFPLNLSSSLPSQQQQQAPVVTAGTTAGKDASLFSNPPAATTTVSSSAFSGILPAAIPKTAEAKTPVVDETGGKVTAS
ncbi:unnamed protein product, partial [Gongylonema pulchrum]|uniref:Uncharacterized protein n=1 Tax=Gongylonema pulchrum TaxID=637853 RepID=A0A183F1J1_9BILA